MITEVRVDVTACPLIDVTKTSYDVEVERDLELPESLFCDEAELGPAPAAPPLESELDDEASLLLLVGPALLLLLLLVGPALSLLLLLGPALSLLVLTAPPPPPVDELSLLLELEREGSLDDELESRLELV